MKINEKIRTLREINNWTQEDMADFVGMSKNGYGKMERGETIISIDKLEKIAEIFDISLIDLLEKNIKTVAVNIGDNCHHVNYCESQNHLTHEIEKLQIELKYKDELLDQKNKEINVLNLLVESLQAQLSNNQAL